VAIGFVPGQRTALAIATELPIEPGDRVLVVRGDLAGDGLATTLRARGAVVDDIVAYRTVEGPPTSGPLLERALAAGSLVAVVFTSGSTVRGLLSIAHAGVVDVRSIPAVCIGPETAAAATAAGFRVLAVSPGHDPSALAHATAVALARQPQEIA
jgi:uroporphyrinogen-III synthase